MLHARPQSNGNMPRDFYNTGTELMGAARKMQRLLAETRAEIMHGRNYQHVETGGVACPREIDLARISRYMEAVIAIEDLGLEIAKEGVE